MNALIAYQDVLVSVLKFALWTVSVSWQYCTWVTMT